MLSGRLVMGLRLPQNFWKKFVSEGVRGATINAIASSMPELFTTIFFLIFLKDTSAFFRSELERLLVVQFFNGMIIPALVILVVLLVVTKSIEVSKKLF